jgi:hypothetical protein
VFWRALVLYHQTAALSLATVKTCRHLSPLTFATSTCGERPNLCKTRKQLHSSQRESRHSLLDFISLSSVTHLTPQCQPLTITFTHASTNTQTHTVSAFGLSYQLAQSDQTHQRFHDTSNLIAHLAHALSPFCIEHTNMSLDPPSTNTAFNTLPIEVSFVTSYSKR